MTPRSYLKQISEPWLVRLLDRWRVELPDEIDLTKSQPELGQAVFKAIGDLPSERREAVFTDIERVTFMAEEAGDTALMGVAPALRDRPGALVRSTELFLNDPLAFQRAEDARFTDHQREGRKWAGYSCARGLLVHRTPEAIAAFKEAIKSGFGTRNVEVEVFERTRPARDGEHRLVQITVYREDRAHQRRVFVSADTLGSELHHPVLEFAITYESATGEVEVVAERAETREAVVDLCSEHLLRTQLGGKAAPPRQFNLEVLRRRHEFATDAEDAIEDVVVNHLRLRPIDTAAERLTLECFRDAADDIWHMAEYRFGGSNPLDHGWRVDQAKLTIRFRSAKGSHSKRSLPISITAPHKCDLRDQTEMERLVGSKYLRRWGLLAAGV